MQPRAAGPVWRNEPEGTGSSGRPEGPGGWISLMWSKLLERELELDRRCVRPEVAAAERPGGWQTEHPPLTAWVLSWRGWRLQSAAASAIFVFPQQRIVARARYRGVLDAGVAGVQRRKYFAGDNCVVKIAIDVMTVLDVIFNSREVLDARLDVPRRLVERAQ